MKNVQSSESSGTNEECAESRVPLKMKTYGGEAECATPHKKNREQAPIDLPETLPGEAPAAKASVKHNALLFQLSLPEKPYPVLDIKEILQKQFAAAGFFADTAMQSVLRRQIQPDNGFFAAVASGKSPTADVKTVDGKKFPLLSRTVQPFVHDVKDFPGFVIGKVKDIMHIQKHIEDKFAAEVPDAQLVDVRPGADVQISFLLKHDSVDYFHKTDVQIVISKPEKLFGNSRGRNPTPGLNKRVKFRFFVLADIRFQKDEGSAVTQKIAICSGRLLLQIQNLAGIFIREGFCMQKQLPTFFIIHI